MSSTEIIPTVQFGLALVFLLLCYKFMYQQTRLDRFREDLFTIRDELFDYIWKNGLGYNLPAYRAMRSMLNGLILFANKFGLGGLLIGAYLSQEERRQDDLLLLI